MNGTFRQFFSGFFAVTALWASLPASAGESRTLSIDVNDVRPLAAVIAELEKRHGGVITYEESAADPGEGELAAKGLRPSSLSLTYQVSAVTNRPADLAAVVEQALGREAGKYRLERDGGVLHVIAIARQGANGRWQPVVPALDAKIDLPEAERSVEATIDAILEAAGNASGKRLQVVDEPLNQARQARVRLGGNGVSARELLTRAVAGLPLKASWKLLSDPRHPAMGLVIYKVAAP